MFQDGAVFDADVLVTKFMAGIANVAAFGREVGIPFEAGRGRHAADVPKWLQKFCCACF